MLLNRRVRVIVPGTRGVSNPDAVLQRRATATVARHFAAWFGGFTVTRGRGGYVSADGKLITERVNLVTSYTGDHAHDADVTALAERIARRMGQESVAVEFEDTAGGMSFVTPRSAAHV